MKREYSKQAERFLDSQSLDTTIRLKSAIGKLPAGDVKKMKGHKNKYRLRVGDFRILFERNTKSIVIERIDNRGQVYKR